jgi:transposase
MSKVKIKVNAASSVIKSQLRKDEKFSQGVRLYAVYQISKGKDAKEIQDMYSTSHKSICNWVHRYNAEGIEGLKDRPRSGRPSLLTDSQKSELDQLIQGSPLEHGYRVLRTQYKYPTATWTGALVADLIKKRFDVEYKTAQIYNILHSLKFSFQKGKGYYPETEERTEEAVEDIKKTSIHR